jgi:hypothetical protein
MTRMTGLTRARALYPEGLVARAPDPILRALLLRHSLLNRSEPRLRMCV